MEVYYEPPVKDDNIIKVDLTYQSSTGNENCEYQEVNDVYDSDNTFGFND